MNEIGGEINKNITSFHWIFHHARDVRVIYLLFNDVIKALRWTSLQIRIFVHRNLFYVSFLLREIIDLLMSPKIKYSSAFLSNRCNIISIKFERAQKTIQ